MNPKLINTPILDKLMSAAGWEKAHNLSPIYIKNDEFKGSGYYIIVVPDNAQENEARYTSGVWTEDDFKRMVVDSVETISATKINCSHRRKNEIIEELHKTK